MGFHGGPDTDTGPDTTSHRWLLRRALTPSKTHHSRGKSTGPFLSCLEYHSTPGFSLAASQKAQGLLGENRGSDRLFQRLLLGLFQVLAKVFQSQTVEMIFVIYIICDMNTMGVYLIRETPNQWFLNVFDLFSFLQGVFGRSLPTLIHTHIITWAKYPSTT